MAVKIQSPSNINTSQSLKANVNGTLKTKNTFIKVNILEIVLTYKKITYVLCQESTGKTISYYTNKGEIRIYPK